MLAPEPYLSACLATLHRAMIENAARRPRRCEVREGPGDSARIADLMDAIENIPTLLTEWERVNEQRIRDYLANYDEQWGANSRFQYLELYEREIAGAAAP